MCRQRHADFVIFCWKTHIQIHRHPKRPWGQILASVHGKPKPGNPANLQGEGPPGSQQWCARQRTPFFFRLRNPHFTGDFSLCSAQKRSKHLIACTPPACTVLYLHREIKTMGVQSQAHPVDLHQAPCSLTSVPAGQGRVRAAPLCLLTRDPHPI